MKVLIAGAGIGGLTTALLCHARGIPCVLYEAAREVREVGVGINVLPHAIGELAALGLLPALDRVGVRTRELAYLTKQGQEVWTELRGIHAGHNVPQFSIHRGRLQKMIHDTVIERLGPDAVRTGRRLAGFTQDESGVTAHFVDSVEGGAGETARGEVLICADGIHSAGRRTFYPGEGSPSWQGVVMWRGAAEWPVWRDGESMAIGDARFLADVLARSEHPRAALWAYEKERLPKTAEVVRTNRLGGPERVIDEVEKHAPAGFTDIDKVLSHEERKAIVKGYASMAGFSKVRALRAS